MFFGLDQRFQNPSLVGAAAASVPSISALALVDEWVTAGWIDAHSIIKMTTIKTGLRFIALSLIDP
jgi:hypothetical protein